MSGPGTGPADVVVGFDLGGSKMAVGVADLAGRLFDTEIVPTRAGQGAEQAIERAIDAGQRLLDRHDATPRGVGVATMGITYDDRVMLAPNVPGWERLALPARFTEHFPQVPLRVDNDVKAAAAAELRWGTLAGVQVGVYVNLGTGVAVALVVDGRIVRGAHGAAGEIGYQPRSVRERDGVRAGHSPLEEFIGGGAIAATYAEVFAEDTSTEQLCRRYSAGDLRAHSFLQPRLEELAVHLANLAIVLDPSRVVVGGGLARSQTVVLPVLTEYLARFAPFPPAVVPARFLHRAGLVGATALALEAGE